MRKAILSAALFLAVAAASPAYAADADSIYDACFSTSTEDLARSSKFTVYAMIVVRNTQPGATHAAREYIAGPYSEAIDASPSPVEAAFHTAADEIAATYSPADQDALIEGCKEDLKQLSTLTPKLRKRTATLVTKAQMVAIKSVVASTSGELIKRGLKAPY